jgi:hypothetical protein
MFSLVLAASCGAASKAEEPLPGVDSRADVSGSATPLDCSLYRNQSGTTPVHITVRNSRPSAIFLIPFSAGCNDSPRRVQVTRAGEEVLLRNGFLCAAPSCQSLQDGSSDALVCNAACVDASVVRLEAGTEMDIGTFTGEFSSHGVVGDDSPMPAECSPNAFGYPEPCWSESPLLSATYQLHARALATCPEPDEECECDSVTGSCTTGVSGPSDDSNGSRLNVTVDAVLPETPFVTLVFQ